MTFDRRAIALAAALSTCLGSCALRSPPLPRGVDCTTDRAVERFPETCDDAGAESVRDE
jgi:hypothetical protein